MNAPAAIVFTFATIALGWLALAPLRGRLSAVGYHLTAYPTGLLAWPVVTCVASLTHRGWDFFSVVVGLGLYVGAGWALIALLAPDRSAEECETPPPEPDVLSYAAYLGSVGAIAGFVGATGIAAVAYDSVFHYAAWGVWLKDTGRITAEVAGAYSVLIPSMIAAARTFGLGWLTSPWPILGAHVIAIVAIAVFEAGRGLRAITRVATAVAAVVLMASTAPFLANSIYLHSHMISAAYLALALWSLSRAAGAPDAGDDASGTDSATAWWFVAGVATAGLALARPDGLAYALVPLGAAIVLRLEGPRSPRGLGAFLGPLLAFVGLAYGAAFVSTRGWGGDKLTARTAAAVIVALAVVGLAGMVIDRVPVFGRLLTKRRAALAAAAAVNALAIALLFALKTDELRATTSIMLGNLTERGGYGSLWLVAAAIIVVSVLWARVWRPVTWDLILLCAIGQFFAVAIVVHGLGHPGRLSPADSFARVAFHAVPLVFWYAGAVALGLARAWRGPAATAVEEGR